MIYTIDRQYIDNSRLYTNCILNIIKIVVNYSKMLFCISTLNENKRNIAAFSQLHIGCIFTLHSSANLFSFAKPAIVLCARTIFSRFKIL